MGLREKIKRGQKSRTRLAFLVGMMLMLESVFPQETSALGWEQREDGCWGWGLEKGVGKLRGEWALLDGARYHFDDEGRMDTGWVMIGEEWYFFFPSTGKMEGQLMTGWQWIDGKCYYFGAEERNGQLPGVMYRNCLTPDGYRVGQSGAWVDEQGQEVSIVGKGITAVGPEHEKKAMMRVGNGSSGSGRSGGGRNPGGGSGSSGGDGSESESPGGESGTKVDDELGINGDSETNSGSGINGTPKDEGISGTETETATPSEAARVRWEVRFVEQAHHENQIFRLQSGESAEGCELSVDFPEEIVGCDGYPYSSTESSPKVIKAGGTGIQKYYVEFIKGERLPSWDSEKDDEGRLRLDRWLEAAKKADREITGKTMEESQIITVNSKESDSRIKNLVSMIGDSGRHEIYLIAVNHTPSALTVGEAFPDTVDISALVMDEFEFSGEPYCVVRIGLKKIPDKAACHHEMVTEELILAGCVSSGSQTERCSRCGFTETFLLPPSGHRDSNGDGICDVCDGMAGGDDSAESRHFRIGDIQMRAIGKRRLRFRCIDDDYSDGNGNNQSSALFLCDSVIRSDIDSDSPRIKEMNFGGSNNYKTSDIRSWLNSNAKDSLFDSQISYTGINTACTGMTEAGAFEQFEEGSLRAVEKPFQLMEDKIFILSAEEAVKYREYLWRFEGSEDNNPETQISACSRGYYLRTPQYAGESGFEYGDGIYAVDLIDGNIHPVDISGTTVGIRPAMTIRQYGN